jgi:hypothetical protein
MLCLHNIKFLLLFCESFSVSKWGVRLVIGKTNHAWKFMLCLSNGIFEINQKLQNHQQLIKNPPWGSHLMLTKRITSKNHI